jgi:hypothetical protein
MPAKSRAVALLGFTGGQGCSEDNASNNYYYHPDNVFNLLLHFTLNVFSAVHLSR